MAVETNWLKDLKGQELFVDGTELLPTKKVWNLIGVSATFNTVTDQIDISIGGAGFDWQESVKGATTANLAATRVGNVLTATGNGALIVDGVTYAVGDRITVKDQTTGADNGIYVASDIGSGSTPFVLTRDVLANETGEITPGMTVQVEEGTANGATYWYVSNTGTITLNSTVIVFTIALDPAATVTSSSAPVADNVIARFDGITGTLIQDSLVILGDGGTITQPNNTGLFNSAGVTLIGSDGPGTTVTVGTSATNTEIDATSSVFFQTSAITRAQLTSTILRLSIPTFDFTSTILSPTIRHFDDTTPGATGDTFLWHAQDMTGGGGSTGGILAARSGDGDTDGDLLLSKGTTLSLLGTTGATLELGGILAAGTRPTTIVIDPASLIAFRRAGSSIGSWDNINFALTIPNILFTTAVVLPVISQQSDGAGDAAGDLFAVNAQDVSGGGTTTSGGDLALRGGASSGASTTGNGGGISITGGAATNAGTNNGGNVVLRTGAGGGATTHGDFFFSVDAGPAGMTVLSSDALSQSLTIGGTAGGGSLRPAVTIDSVGQTVLRSAGSFALGITNAELDLVLPLISFRFNTVSGPIIRQDTDATADITGDLFTMHAQDVSGGGTTITGGAFLSRGGDASGAATNDVGGAWTGRPGSGTTTNGVLQLQDGGGTARYTISSAGDSTVNTSGIGTLARGGAERLGWSNLNIHINATNIAWRTGIVLPRLSQDDAASAAGDDMEMQAQSVLGTSVAGGDLRHFGGDGDGGTNCTGGNVLLGGGLESGTGLRGNVVFHVRTAPAFNAMEDGIFVGDATTVPTGNPTAGGYMYAEAGAGKWRGSSGTITTFGPADPHCPECGRDCAVEWERPGEWKLAVCMWCVTDALGDKGVIYKEAA